MYCIYSGKEIEEKDSNIEHIIPKSLGGCDEFTIRVSEKINSKVGSQIDGRLTQDFLVALNRIKLGNRGHSNKPPIYKVPSRAENGEPLISTFTSEELVFYDPKENIYIQSPGKVQMRTSINLDLRKKFVAKVALSVGFFLFGKEFEDYTDCEDLRMLIKNERIEEVVRKYPEKFNGIRFYDSLMKIKDSDKPMVDTYKMFCEHNGKSNVLWTYSPKSIIVHVAILGKFVGLINFKADVKKIPEIENGWLGHLMICEGNMLIRKSWRDGILEMCEAKKLLSEDELRNAKSFKG